MRRGAPVVVVQPMAAAAFDGADQGHDLGMFALNDPDLTLDPRQQFKLAGFVLGAAIKPDFFRDQAAHFDDVRIYRLQQRVFPFLPVEVADQHRIGQLLEELVGVAGKVEISREHQMRIAAAFGEVMHPVHAENSAGGQQDDHRHEPDERANQSLLETSRRRHDPSNR